MKPAFPTFACAAVAWALAGPAATAGQEPMGPGPSSPPGSYVLPPLPMGERANLAGEFLTRNGFTRSSPECDSFEAEYGRPSLVLEINDYGLISKFRWCPGSYLRVEIRDREQAIEVAKDFLVRNSEVTGVTRKEELTVSGSYPIAGCLARCGEEDAELGTTALKVRFADQVMAGLEISGTGMEVFVNAETVYEMYGHWFPPAEFELVPRLSEREAMTAAVGTSLVYYDIAGMPNEETVTRESVKGAELAIDRVEHEGTGLSLALVWKVFVSTPLPWVVWIDDATGKVLRVVQKFMT